MRHSGPEGRCRGQSPGQRPKPTRTRGKPRPIGVPGLTLCRIDQPASRRPPHNVIPGSLGERLEISSPGCEEGRRRAIGVVAALPVSPARPRRWCDAEPLRRQCVTAAQKAGAEDRVRGSVRNQGQGQRQVSASAAESSDQRTVRPPGPDVHGHLRVVQKETCAIRGSQADQALQLFDEVRAMTWRLLNPRP